MMDIGKSTVGNENSHTKKQWKTDNGKITIENQQLTMENRPWTMKKQPRTLEN